MKTRRIRNIGILSIIIVIVLANSCLASARPLQEPKTNGLFNFQFVMYMTWDANATAQPIQPGEIREVPLTISTFVTHGLLGEILLRFYENRAYPIQLSITGKPVWCNAQLSVGTLTGVIKPDQIVTLHSSLLIQVSEDAPDNITLGYVNIHGVINHMKGLFNIRTLIQGFEQDTTVSFVTGT